MLNTAKYLPILLLYVLYRGCVVLLPVCCRYIRRCCCCHSSSSSNIVVARLGKVDEGEDDASSKESLERGIPFISTKQNFLLLSHPVDQAERGDGQLPLPGPLVVVVVVLPVPVVPVPAPVLVVVAVHGRTLLWLLCCPRGGGLPATVVWRRRYLHNG